MKLAVERERSLDDSIDQTHTICLEGEATESFALTLVCATETVDDDERFDSSAI